MVKTSRTNTTRVKHAVGLGGCTHVMHSRSLKTIGPRNLCNAGEDHVRFSPTLGGAGGVGWFTDQKFPHEILARARGGLTR